MSDKKMSCRQLNAANSRELVNGVDNFLFDCDGRFLGGSNVSMSKRDHETNILTRHVTCDMTPQLRQKQTKLWTAIDDDNVNGS